MTTVTPMSDDFAQGNVTGSCYYPSDRTSYLTYLSVPAELTGEVCSDCCVQVSWITLKITAAPNFVHQFAQGFAQQRLLKPSNNVQFNS